MTRRRTTILAALLCALLTAVPAAAQEAVEDGMVLTAEDELFCEPGALGVSGEYTAPMVADGDVVRAAIAFQCGEFLSDGTYIPEGYRLQITYACAPQECSYPFAFANQTHRERVYVELTHEGQTRYNFRISPNRRGQLVLNVVEVDLGTRERERRR